MMHDNVQFLEAGVLSGWWEDYDAATGNPVRVFKMSDFHDTALMAHAYYRLGCFDSIKQAKRAGHVQPLTPGEIRIGTRQARIEY